MSGRLAFQTQLASIMEVLANAAVAEICKLVEDDYAVVSLQMSQCQRENKALKRKLHLLELKMARGNAERRLRESGLNGGGRARVQIHGGPQESSSRPDAAFERSLDVPVWSGRSAPRTSTAEMVLSESLQRKSPGVEEVEEVEALVVKEEQQQEDGALLGDGVLELLPCKAAPQRPRLEHQNSQSTCSQNQNQNQSQNQNQNQNQSQSQSSICQLSSSSRGVEVSGSSPLLKCDLSGSVEGRLSLHPAVTPLHPAVTPLQPSDGGGSVVLCDSDRSSNSLVEGFYDKPSGVEVEERSPSCSYSMAAADFPPSSSSVNGWTPYRPAYPPPQAFGDGGKAPPRVGKERLFVCSYCGKTFNRPKKVEIHQRVHTGEKPFSCSTCGKMFSEAGNLRKHQRVHTGEKPYSCGMCGRGFAWIRNLKTHQQKSHPEVYTEEENFN